MNIKILLVDNPISEVPLHKQLVSKLTLFQNFSVPTDSFDRDRFLRQNLASSTAKRGALICEIIVAIKLLSPNVMRSEIVMGVFQL